MNEIILTKDNFEQEVLKKNRTVVVDFFANWCGPCKAMNSILERLMRESGDSIIVGKINIDEEEELSNLYRVLSIPTIKIFHNGKIAASAVGFTPYEKLMDMISKAKSKSAE